MRNCCGLSKSLFIAVVSVVLAFLLSGCSQQQTEETPPERFPQIVSNQPIEWKDENLKKLVYDALMKDYSEDVYPYELSGINRLFIMGNQRMIFGNKPSDCGLTEDGTGFHYKGIMLNDDRYQDVDRIFTESVSMCLDDLRYFTDLTDLDIYLVNPQDMTVFSQLPKLKFLKAGLCDLSDLSGIENSPALISVYMQYCNITDISPLARLPLYNMDLKGNMIEDISPLALMDEVPSNLVLSYNNISDISPLAPNGRATVLAYLNLRNNNITDISPLSEYTNISILSLTYNNIADVSPLTGLNRDNHIHLGGNPVENIDILKGFYTIYTAP